MNDAVTKPAAAPSSLPLPDSHAAIDWSCRWPVTLFCISSVKWLLGGLILLLLASLQRHLPEFLSNVSWLTHGRLLPAAKNALAYGFGFQAGFVLLIWIMARLNRSVVQYSGGLLLAGGLWNFGVVAGVIGILAGGSTGFEWLEMPSFSAPFLFVAYVILAIVVGLNFHARYDRVTYPSQWYLLGALLWWPWSWTVAQAMLVFSPAQGVVQAVVHGWYVYNLFILWFVPLAIATIFYFVPKLIERPLHSRYLAGFGFWTLALAAPFSGMVYYLVGPLPAWLISVSVAFSLFLLIPLLSVILNYHWTVEGARKHWKGNVVLQFCGCAMLMLVLFGVLQIVSAFRGVGHVIHLTLFWPGQTHLALFGFFTLAVMGAFYYIIPRTTRLDWPNPSLTTAHFWLHSLAMGLLILSLLVGGVVQGFALNDTELTFAEIQGRVAPFLKLYSVAVLVLLGSAFLFALNLFRLAWNCCWMICRSQLEVFQPKGRTAPNTGVAS